MGAVTLYPRWASTAWLNHQRYLLPPTLLGAAVSFVEAPVPPFLGVKVSQYLLNAIQPAPPLATAHNTSDVLHQARS